MRQHVIAIDKGRLSGSQIGLTARGRIDLDHARLDLDGTIVPIYGLNWALGKVPLVGQFLAGREGEGAFAVTYSVTGPTSDPQISVNPLAVLAPGFIRDLFNSLTDDSAGRRAGDRAQVNLIRAPGSGPGAPREGGLRAPILDRAHPGVALLAGREQQLAVDQVVEADRHRLVLDLAVVEPGAAAPDQPPRLAVARRPGPCAGTARRR